MEILMSVVSEISHNGASFLAAPGKENAWNAGDPGSIPGLGRSPGEENGNPLQYSCLENSMDREVWQAIVHGVARVGHDLAPKLPLNNMFTCASLHVCEKVDI